MRSHVVLFGDSITEQSFKPNGWGSALANTYTRKVDVVVRGYGGYKSRWALFLLQTLLVGYTNPPVAVTIFFGANDAALLGRTSERQHVPVEEYKENLRKIVHHFKELSPAMLVVIIIPPPIDEEGRNEYARELSERTNEVTGVYAKQCIELAKELGVYSINLWSKMQETEGWQKKFLSSQVLRNCTFFYGDGLHLTAEGNAIVHEEVVRVFSEGGLDATQLASDYPHHSEIDPKNLEKSFQERSCTAGL
ncbi:GDSL esterase/lipase At5g62930-like isoform X1 [Papaver somniferum]|uniref:GDSL esterase/lipase At5g62930-like isoform X1 n=1 Tax=Papaver somniferum TaxID=3469 RepID=UPI000E6F5D05|nr:GDSL esterase/lipase At5g62930-like isoform X1 [Papaver somniferum]